MKAPIKITEVIIKRRCSDGTWSEAKMIVPEFVAIDADSLLIDWKNRYTMTLEDGQRVLLALKNTEIPEEKDVKKYSKDDFYNMGHQLISDYKAISTSNLSEMINSLNHKLKEEAFINSWQVAVDDFIKSLK